MPIVLEAALFGVLALALVFWHLRLWQRDRSRIAAQPVASVCPLQQSPLVSVLVPAWNEADNLPAHIAAFESLTYPAKELILCAGGTDGSYDIACQHANANIHVLEQVAGEGKQSALRRSLQLAHGDVIFLTDADCLLTEASFTCTLAPILNEHDVVTTGGYAPLPEQRNNAFVRTQWYIDVYARSGSPAYVEGLIGRNAAITRTALLKVNAFDEPVPIGTDYFLARKLAQAGERVRFVQASRVETEFKTTIRSYLRQQSRWLRNILLHGRTFGAEEQARSATIQCLIGLAIVAFPLTFLVIGWLGVALWGAALLHGTLARWRYLRFGQLTLKQPHRIDVYLMSPLTFLLDQVMLAYTLLDWVSPARRWKW
jgi:cellulose synthase/poly-beta-1,6-N-acetylglucosamine synthase-like glycosyltransferase